MASRKPLVLNNGQVQQLQPGDTLSISETGGVEVLSLTNDNGSTAVCGSPVYSSAADHFNLAEANASGTAGVIGLVNDPTILTTVAGNVAVGGVLALTTAQWDAVFGTSGGLTYNTVYYLSPSTPGNGTSTAPSTVGQYVVKLGRAISTTELKIEIGSPILL